MAEMDTGADISNINAKNIVANKTLNTDYLTFEFEGTKYDVPLVAASTACSILAKFKCYIIKTPISMGGKTIETLLSVSEFSTVIGRNTIKQLGFLIDPSKKFVLTKKYF